jgi:hypothetical protein
MGENNHKKSKNYERIMKNHKNSRKNGFLLRQ